MGDNPFMNIGDDPTSPIKWDSVSLEQQYNQLSAEDKELIFLKLNGYEKRPPEVERLYSDDYYMGKFYGGGNNIFPFWKGVLKDIFPGSITRYPYLALSGAIGIGKSLLTKLCMSMTYARISCMKDPYKTFRLAPKPMSFVIFHRQVDSAETEFKRWFERDVLVDSPFFKQAKEKIGSNIKIMVSGPQGGGGLGSDVIFFVLGEINFWPNQDKAVERMNSSILRFKSRYNEDVLRLAGQFIVDSSARNSGDAQQVFLDNAPSELTWTCAPAHFEVKPQDYKQSGGRTFPLYKGDGRFSPQILDPDKPLNPEMDPDRIIRVPIQCLGDARADVYKFLQDVCGVSTGSSDSFFNGDLSHLSAVSTEKNSIPETFYIDFYNKEDRIMSIVEPQLASIPKNVFLSVGLDIAIASDTAGISISAFDHWADQNGTQVPVYKCYALFGLTRKDGQETSLFHIQQFIEDLSMEYQLMVCADQAYSKPIFQDCQRLGIQTRYFSTDRTMELGTYLKNIINREQISLPKNDRLQREAYDLRVVTRGQHLVIDHPAINASKILDNKDGSKKPSKDLWDALSQSIYGVYMNITEGAEFGFNTGYTKQMDLIKRMTHDPREDSAHEIQGMIENIW